MKKYLHTLLFAIYPILFYFNINKNEIFLSNIFTPLLYCLIFAGFIFSIFYFIIKRKENVGVLASTFILLFFSYGHVLIELGKTYKNLIIGIWLLVCISIVILSIKKSFKKINPALNFI